MTASFRRILVGWDGSADAAEALRAAAAIVGHQGGHVVALAVVRPHVRQESTEDRQNESDAIRRQAEEQFSTLRRQSGAVSGLRLTVHVLTEGNAGPARPSATTRRRTDSTCWWWAGMVTAEPVATGSAAWRARPHRPARFRCSC